MTVLQPICTQYIEIVRTSCTVRQNSTYSAFQYVTYSAAVTVQKNTCTVRTVQAYNVQYEVVKNRRLKNERGSSFRFSDSENVKITL